MIKDLLESGGIETLLRSAKVRPYPVNMGKMGEVKILVQEEDLTEARELIDAMGAGPDGDPDVA